MSIRSLVTTTLSQTEAGIKGLTKVGNTIGESMTWLERQAQQLNSVEAIKKEEMARQISNVQEIKTLLGLDVKASADETKKAMAQITEEYEAIFG